MLTDEDKALWEAYTKTVKPLKTKKSLGFKALFSPRHWFVRKQKQELPNVLDLHQMTLQEAFHIFNRFIEMHFNEHTPKVVVITGRGKNDQGQLKKEFSFWMEHTDIKGKIKSFHKQNEGSFEIELRKKC